MCANNANSVSWHCEEDDIVFGSTAVAVTRFATLTCARCGAK